MDFELDQKLISDQGQVIISNETLKEKNKEALHQTKKALKLLSEDPIAVEKLNSSQPADSKNKKTVFKLQGYEKFNGNQDRKHVLDINENKLATKVDATLADKEGETIEDVLIEKGFSPFLDHVRVNLTEIPVQLFDKTTVWLRNSQAEAKDLRDFHENSDYNQRLNMQLDPEDIMVKSREKANLFKEEDLVQDMDSLTVNPIICGSHFDYGTITLVIPDDVGGLNRQDMSKRGDITLSDDKYTGDWDEVKCEHGDVILQFGKCMEMMTGGIIPATPHRVVDHGRERISMIIFIDADKGKVISTQDFHPTGFYTDFKREEIKDFLDSANTTGMMD